MTDYIQGEDVVFILTCKRSIVFPIIETTCCVDNQILYE